MIDRYTYGYEANAGMSKHKGGSFVKYVDHLLAVDEERAKLDKYRSQAEARIAELDGKIAAMERAKRRESYRLVHHEPRVTVGGFAAYVRTYHVGDIDTFTAQDDLVEFLRGAGMHAVALSRDTIGPDWEHIVAILVAEEAGKDSPF